MVFIYLTIHPIDSQGLIGNPIFGQTNSIHDFIRDDFDIQIESSISSHVDDGESTLSHLPQVRPHDTDCETMVCVGNTLYTCVKTEAKILQLGRNDSNDIVLLEKSFPRYALRLCLYTIPDPFTQLPTYLLKVKAAGYGNDNGKMVMKLTDKAHVLNHGHDFSTSNAVVMFTGPSLPNVGDNVLEHHRCIVSIKGDVYSTAYPYPLRHYSNLLHAGNPVGGYQCGDVYIRIQLHM